MQWLEFNQLDDNLLALERKASSIERKCSIVTRLQVQLVSSDSFINLVSYGLVYNEIIV